PRPASASARPASTWGLARRGATTVGLERPGSSPGSERRVHTPHRHVVAVDLGTSGPKVALVGEDGGIAAHTARPVRTRVVPPDHAVQDPEEVWQATATAMREVLSRSPEAARSTVALICSSQFSSIVPV